MRRSFVPAALATGLVVAACAGTDPAGETADDTLTTGAASAASAASETLATPSPEPTTAPTTPPEPTAAPTTAPEPTTAPPPEPVAAVTVSRANLPVLDGAGIYQLRIDGQMVGELTGSSGQIVELTEPPADSSVLTVTVGDAPAIATGSLSGGSADLTFAGVAGTDFADASGQYILATPTDGTTGGLNERSGVWWTLVPRSQSLFLPTLAGGWVYEGWTIIDGVPVTSGTFTEPFGAPDDAAPFSGPQSGPPLVGEDYLTNPPAGLQFPVDLRDQVVAITVEPVDDDDPAPFPAVVLRGTVPADAVDHVAYPVDNLAADLPRLTITLTP